MMSYNKVQHLTNTLVLELFHMDLMGAMQVESFGGRDVSLYVLMITPDTHELILFVRSQMYLLCLRHCVIACNVKKDKRVEI